MPVAQSWIGENAPAMAQAAERDLEALVAISSPSADLEAAERAVAVATAMAPPGAEAARLPSSTPGHAPDLLLTVRGPGTRRLLLVGHLDTVVAHEEFISPRRSGSHLIGSGTYDMKGGDAIALGLLGALAGREELAEASLLLVNDEEWRTGPFAHAPRFAGFDACLCFEGGQRADGGEDAVVVRRKAAIALRVTAKGRAAHSGSAPERGANALLALAEVARIVAACSDPDGPERLTAVPTEMEAGVALNVVPPAGELVCDLRADRIEAFDPVEAAIPARVGEVAIEVVRDREWPGMDSAGDAAGVLAGASQALGRPLVAGERGGASDASHFAATIPVTIDGLGPCGGHAHHPDEYVEVPLLGRCEVALAVADAILKTP
ncbi:MAG: M20/M25/M40 family metallo-hydrolase [Solirubrobacterales bacterium]